MQQTVEEHKLKITKIVDEAPETKTFRVGVPENIEINFLPGQFFMVRFEDDGTFKRPYSIASSPTEKNHLDITMNLVGEFTKKLWECNVGDYLLFKGPYGKFYFDESMKQDLILIGGGLGVTPFRSIVRYCHNKKLQNRIKLIYSVRTQDDVIYKEELKKHLNYKLILTVTKPKDGWQGRTGRIDEKLLKENISDMENPLFFLCGSLSFVKDMTHLLEKLGAKREQIKRDIWGNYKNGA